MSSIMASAGLVAILSFSCLGQAAAGAASSQSKKENEMEVKRGYAPVDGLRIYYEIHGTASPTPSASCAAPALVIVGDVAVVRPEMQWRSSDCYRMRALLYCPTPIT